MPSSYINSDNIGNVYLNRLDGAVLQGEPIPYSSASGDAFRELFTVKFTDTRTIWTPTATSGSLVGIAIRFPVAWETLTGNIPVPDVSVSPNNARVALGLGVCDHGISSTNTTANAGFARSSFSGVANFQYCFAVLNDYAFAWCSFSSTARTASSFGYIGWLRNDSGGSGGRYTGTQFPRNFCVYNISNSHTWTGGLNVSLQRVARRVSVENLTAAQDLYSTNDTTFNPAINCTGDSTPLIFRDSTSPFPRVGMTYHLFRIPSSCTIGQVYKMATDPDNSNKPYVICCGNWGSFKVGMRVWADGYT